MKFLAIVCVSLLLAVSAQEQGSQQQNVTQCAKPLSLFNTSYVQLLWTAPNQTNQNVFQSYCSIFSQMPDVAQCIVFSNDTQLVGIQHVITLDIFKKLPDEEKKFWHSLQFEIMNGLLLVNQTNVVPQQQLEPLQNNTDQSQQQHQQQQSQQNATSGLEEQLVKFANSYGKMFNIFGNMSLPVMSSGGSNSSSGGSNSSSGGMEGVKDLIGVIPFGVPQLHFTVLKEDEVDPKIGQLFEASQDHLDIKSLLQGVQGLEEPQDKHKETNKVPVLNYIMTDIIKANFGGQNATSGQNATTGGQA